MFSRRRSMAVILACLLSITAPITALATDYQFYQNNGVLYYNPDAGTCSAAAGVEATDIDSGSLEQNKKAMLEYLVGKGLTLAAAAGVAGNTQVESGFNPRNIQNPAGDSPLAKKGPDGQIDVSTIFKPKDGQGYGLAQWTFGGTTGPRQGPLYKSAVNTKTDIGDLGLQLDYLWKELSSNYKISTLDKIRDMNDAGEAAKIYMVNFEGPADQSAAAQNGRAEIAEGIYNKYKNIIQGGADVDTSSTDSTGTAGCAPSDDAVGGVGIANGFTFPLKTTQAKIKKGTDGVAWCFSSLANCHHDYNAADIFAETGTPILAAKGGKVMTKQTSCSTYGCNVTVMGEDKVLYYYTHMSKAPPVNVGQQVAGGDVIGAVGTNATAVGTARHLHIDMLPGSQYKSRVSCASASCSSYPFIKIQEYLVPAFKQLPQ